MTSFPQQAPPPGLRVGDYELLTRLGEGGMGVVHLARRPGGDRVALKVLRPHVVGDDEARARLAREVDTLSRIRSPRVAEVLDSDPWGEVPYVVTRYVPGLSLQDDVAEEGPFETDDLRWTARLLAEALEAVHAVGVLHRDVKPSNVLMEGRNPVLIDFGLARLADDPRLTQVGWLLGTPGYLAPEILHGDDPTPASDVHSLAATIAFAGTGRPPYGGGPAVAIMDRVRRGQHDLRGLDPAIKEVVRAALDPDPGQRPSLPVLRAWLEQGTMPVRRVATRPWEDEAHAPTARLPVSPPDEGVGADWSPREWREDEWPEDQWRGDEWPREDRREDAWPQDRWADEDGAGADWAPDQGEEPQRASFGERLRGLTVLLGLGVAGAGAVAVAPYVAVALLLTLVWLLRSGSLAASAAGERRRLRGARWYDAPMTAMAAPYHLLASVPGTVVLALWATGAGLAVALLCFALGLSETWSLGLVGAGLVMGVWIGPGSGRVRRPVRRVVRPLAARPVAWLVGAAAVLALATGLVALAQSAGTHWLPAGDAPWREISISGLR